MEVAKLLHRLGMTLIAHLSDLHLLEDAHHRRRGLARHRLAFLSAGVPLDAARRRRKVLAALRAAKRAQAEHVVITGDLCEDGVDEQFEVLAEVLDQSGLDPQCITLIPGNHDAYADPSAWDRALAGPLAAYQKTSSLGAQTVLDDAVIKPISTVLPDQLFLWSAGEVKASDVHAIRCLADDSVSRDRAVVVAQHHPPARRALAVIEWVDGLAGSDLQAEVLTQRAAVHVLHGHAHRRVTRSLCGREHAQVYGVDSVRDAPDSVRLYRAQDGRLHEFTAQPARSVSKERGVFEAAFGAWADVQSA